MASTQPCVGLRRVVAALLLAAGVACAGGSARAGCGDYLTIGTPRISHDIPLELPTHPCDGPNCSAAPVPTPVPMTGPAPAPSSAKDSASGSQFATDPFLTGDGFARPASNGRAVLRPTSVFHPPRHS
jgi:hypothetical protein